MGQERIDVAPEVLAWAREAAGLTPELAAKRLGVTVATLSKWESGALAPTIAQLRKAAKRYGRPLPVLLLAETPTEKVVAHEFRSESARNQQTWSPELRREYARALDQRDVFLELGDSMPAAVERAERPTGLSQAAPIEDAAHQLREWLSPQNSSGDQRLNAWVAAAEQKGILVIQTAGVAVAEMRGFSLAEWPFPVVALNGTDSRRARLFTLAHEICHLLLNAGGICDLHDSENPQTADDRTEKYCNSVGAAALVPRNVLLALPQVSGVPANFEWTLPELDGLSARFGISAESFLLRLISVGRATWATYWLRRPEFQQAYEEARTRARETDGGPSFYVVKARNLGKAYVLSVLEAFESRAISSLDVADFLGVRYDQVDKLASEARK